MENGSTKDWILEHLIQGVAGGSETCHACGVCAMPWPVTQRCPSWWLYPVSYSMEEGMEWTYVGTAPGIHYSLAFSAQLVRCVVNLCRSRSLRIGVPTVSPGAPCTRAFGKAWSSRFHVTAFTALLSPLLLGYFCQEPGPNFIIHLQMSKCHFWVVGNHLSLQHELHN